MTPVSGLAERLGRVGRGYVAVARSPSYLPLWLAQLVSTFGDTLHYIALVILVYQLTGQGVAVAVLVVAEIIPVLLLGPVAGVIIDRFSRKGILIGADLIRAALVLSLLWPQGVWHAYLVAAGLAAGNTFFNPTVQAVIPVLTTDEQRLAANSVAWSTGRLVQILAATLAGGLIALIGTDVAFVLNAATFVISALLLVRLHIPAHAGQIGAQAKQGIGNFFTEARAGLSFRRPGSLCVTPPARAVHRFLRRGRDRRFADRALRTTPGLTTCRLWLADRGDRGGGAAWAVDSNVLATDYRDARWLFVP